MPELCCIDFQQHFETFKKVSLKVGTSGLQMAQHAPEVTFFWKWNI